jgi:hypothetical protein
MIAVMVEEIPVGYDADRSAIEHIRGAPLPRRWPVGAMVAGTRVRVVQSEDWVGPWERIFTGTISGMGAPEELTDDRARPGELAYWVDFDEPQMDFSEDGPYRKALIWERYLQAL